MPALATWTKPLGRGFGLLVLATELGPLTLLTGLPSAAHALTGGSFPGRDPDGRRASLATLLAKPGARHQTFGIPASTKAVLTHRRWAGRPPVLQRQLQGGPGKLRHGQGACGREEGLTVLCARTPQVLQAVLGSGPVHPAWAGIQTPLPPSWTSPVAPRRSQCRAMETPAWAMHSSPACVPSPFTPQPLALSNPPPWMRPHLFSSFSDPAPLPAPCTHSDRQASVRTVPSTWHTPISALNPGSSCCMVKLAPAPSSSVPTALSACTLACWPWSRAKLQRGQAPVPWPCAQHTQGLEFAG
ncbi:uncharacterized protein [Symphalangus syndactylus]|uniref:uncharacterized protein n=1 Tax=Symphalangus syndactylus TaxID=9590 RepID=UPI003004BDE7